MRFAHGGAIGEGRDESPLREWVSVLGRHRTTVIVAVIVATLAAFFASANQERLYEASATVLVNQQNPTAQALNLTSGATTPPDRYAATQAALARVGVIAERAVGAAHIEGHTGAGLLAHSSVTSDPNTDLLTFSVSDPNPAVAKRLATSYAVQFTVYRRGLDTNALSTAIASLHNRLTGLEAAGDRGSPLFRQLQSTSRDLEALQALQASGSSAVVVGRAGGASLVQPRTSRNVLLGLLLGGGLGVALAFLRESLDTRVRTPDELRERLGIPLLGHISNPAPEATSNGQLVALWSPTGATAEAFRIVKTNLEIAQLEQDAASIVITSATTDEGTASVAANLAVTLARSRRDVILVDLDLRQSGIEELFDLPDRPGFTGVAVGEVTLSEALRRVDVHGDAPSADAGLLEVMPAGQRPPDPGEFLTSGFVGTALKELEARCDVLLIHAPPMLAVGDAMTIARHADAVILVTEVNHVHRPTVAEARRVLEVCPALVLGFIATNGTRDDGYWSRLRGKVEPHV
jgi:capsular exopolysaccharide synthesis family protein